jgi:hypothetical protein
VKPSCEHLFVSVHELLAPPFVHFSYWPSSHAFKDETHHTLGLLIEVCIVSRNHFVKLKLQDLTHAHGHELLECGMQTCQQMSKA